MEEFLREIGMKKTLEQRKNIIKKIFGKSDLFTINFICSGNIIRSPYAHLLFQHMIDNDSRLKKRIKVESSGVKYRNNSISYESSEILLKKGVSEERIRKFKPRFFIDYPNIYDNVDLILVMERNHIKYLPKSVRNRAFLLREFAQGISENVPDPFFDPPFERAYLMIDKSLDALLDFFSRSY